MSATGSVITIVLSAFTGWITIKAAATLMFHPIRPVKILRFTLQGFFPKNQQLIVKKIGALVSKDLFSFDEIKQKVTDPENLEKLKPEIEAHIDHFLRNKLKDVFPMLAMMIGEKTIVQLKGAFLLELELLFPVLMQNYMNKLEEDIDIELLLTEKLSNLPPEKIEIIVKQLSGRQIWKLELLGLIVGLLFGILQVLVGYLIK